MGHACVTSEYAAMTTELNLRFVAPTPIGRPIQVAARLRGRRGRRLLLTGEISVDGRVSVTANAVFMTLTESNVAAIFGSPA
jgi:predicted thioesterase